MANCTDFVNKLYWLLSLVHKHENTVVKYMKNTTRRDQRFSMNKPSPKFMGGIKEILGEYGWLPPFHLLWQYGGPMSILAKIIR